MIDRIFEVFLALVIIILLARVIIGFPWTAIVIIPLAVLFFFGNKMRR